MTYKDFKQGLIVECYYFKAVMLEPVKDAPATLWKGVVIGRKPGALKRIGDIDEFIYDSFTPVKHKRR